MSEADPHRLRFGPYSPPALRVGEYVVDEVRGVVRVRDWVTAGAIMWPRGIRDGRSPGKPALILTGDLVRAVRRESASAVADHWGVSRMTVLRWRRALGVCRVTEGTRALLAEQGNPGIGEHAREGAAALHSDPDAEARRAQTHSATLRAKPGWREHMLALARRPKRRRAHPRTVSLLADAITGRYSVADLAAKHDRSVSAVAALLRRYGVDPAAAVPRHGRHPERDLDIALRWLVEGQDGAAIAAACGLTKQHT